MDKDKDKDKQGESWKSGLLNHEGFSKLIEIASKAKRTIKDNIKEKKDS